MFEILMNFKGRLWATVCLSDGLSVCDLGVLWPNDWMD